MPQTTDRKKAWVRANQADRYGLSPPQYRLLHVLYELRLRDGVQAFHGEVRISRVWVQMGGSSYAPLRGMLAQLQQRGYADRGTISGWRLHHLPAHVLTQAAGRHGVPVEGQLRLRAQPRTAAVAR